MPRKTQFNSEDIIKAAIELVRKQGLAKLSAAAVAEEMGCSTMPIYSHSKNMQTLEDEVVRRVWKLVMEYQAESYTGNVWVDQGIGWVVFSRDEENLFKCLTDNNNIELRLKMQVKHWQYLADRLEAYDGFDGMDEELSERVRYAHALLTHGLATSARTGFNKIIIEDDRILFGYMKNASLALIKGYKQLPPVEEADRNYVKEKLKALVDRQLL
jgi:AcrR family transcriptional regulator